MHQTIGVGMFRLDDDSSIKKLKSIIQNRFGKGLEISRLSEVTAVEPTLDFFFKESDLLIPIFQDKIYLGLARVPRADGLEPKNLESLTTLVKMTLIPILYSQYQDVQESNLKINNQNEDSINLLGSDDFGIRDFQISEESECTKNILISNVIHLNGIKEICRKVAHQIHEIDTRWAFLPFENVRAEFKSIESIESLGHITIFIEDVLKLTSSEQKIISLYKNQSRKNSYEGPLIVLGSQLPINELAEDPDLGTEIKDVMNEQTFEVNRAPLTYSKLKEAVEILFFASQD